MVDTWLHDSKLPGYVCLAWLLESHVYQGLIPITMAVLRIGKVYAANFTSSTGCWFMWDEVVVMDTQITRESEVGVYFIAPPPSL